MGRKLKKGQCKCFRGKGKKRTKICWPKNSKRPVIKGAC